MQANGLSIGSDAIVIGSDAHKELFCRSFIDTHDPYDPQPSTGRRSTPTAVARLRAMPFWGEAIPPNATSRRRCRHWRRSSPIRCCARPSRCRDTRKGGTRRCSTRCCATTTSPCRRSGEEPQRGDPLWNFMRVGYGECFDSFFAFGLYTLARDSGLFPPALLKTMEPIVQEEARHILFFVNWIAYCRARQPAPRRLAAQRPLRAGDGAAGVDARQDRDRRCARRRRRRQRGGRLHARRQGLARGGELAAPVPRGLPARERPPPGAPTTRACCARRFVPAIARALSRVLR